MKSPSEYTEEDLRALRDLELASTALKKAVGGKQGEALEKNYGIAYNKCYRLGLKQYKLQVCTTTR